MRECAGCTLCCSILGVDGLKIPRTPCRHQEEGVGCRIYIDRPEDCRDFKCAWRLELLPEHLKPSEVGYVVEVVDTSQAFIHTMDDDDFLEKPVQLITDALRHAMVAVVYSRFR